MNVKCSECRLPFSIDHQPAPGARVLVKCDGCRRNEERANRIALAEYYDGNTLYAAAGRVEPKLNQ